MMRMRIMIVATVGLLTATSANGEYSLKISNGKLPEDVTTENLNGNVPIEDGYKNGWTDKGWTSGDYGTTKNVLLSPSFLSTDQVCESALTLPMMTIGAGEYLFWRSRAVYPIRDEKHTVELRRKGEYKWIVLDEAEDSGTVWKQRMIDLSDYAESECEIRFVCRSQNGYMLALTDINIATPDNFSFEGQNETSKFFGLSDTSEGCVPVDFAVRNLGKAVHGVSIRLIAGGSTVDESICATEWATGESKTFSLLLPISINERTDYKIVMKDDDGNEQTIDESFAFLSSIKRHLLVDKGTGMWCNNCPVGTLKIEELERTYGESLITVETHNGDPLANDTYFNWLGYYAIPRFELNRNKSTEGESDKYFNNYLCVPTEMGITVTEITDNDDGTLSVTAKIEISEQFIVSDRTYRIGYVMTRDVDGSTSTGYYQSNNCSITQYQQYYYLPSKIISQLCYFPNISLPSPLATTSEDIAFTGIPDSLPATLEAGHTYTATWDVPLPTRYTKFDGMRIVAYILDAGNRKVLNTTAAYINDFSEVKPVLRDMTSGHDNTVYSIDGQRLGNSTDGLASGIYIVNGKKVKL